MEAAGFEPASRDNPNAGLYMLSRSFNLNARGGDRHSPRASRHLYLAFRPTSVPESQPANCNPSVADIPVD